MLTVCFLGAVISSVVWLGYILLYIREQLSGADFSSLEPVQTAVYVGLTVVPIWIIWQVFGFILQYKKSQNIDEQIVRLLEQGKKNQDYTDLIVRALLESEHEIKDGFVINKFDVFVADLNELLADIVLRSNAASSLQLEQLWTRVKNGERWVIAKTLVEAAKRQNGFSAYLSEKVQRDKVFRGTLMEFCARYQDLSALLEKHDRDRVFLNIVETGVLGSVYNFLAPIVDTPDSQSTPIISHDEEEDEVDNGFSEEILNMPEPESEETPSFWGKLNPFNKEKKQEVFASEPVNEDEHFFEKLQNDFNEPVLDRTDETTDIIPTLSADNPQEDALSSFLQEDSSPSLSMDDVNDKEPVYMPAPSVNMDEPSVFEKEMTSTEQKPSLKSDNENFAYPFGGWINEDNYK